MEDALIRFEERPPESPYVERVWRSTSERGGMFTSIAESRGEIVFSRVQGECAVTVRGAETRGSSALCPAEGEWLSIRFRLGTYFPEILPGVLRDRNDVSLAMASGRRFWWKGSAWEVPTFDNADVFVGRLVRARVIQREPVSEEAPRMGVRTAQRHFLRATGMTQRLAWQIERARKAVHLLRGGMAMGDVVGEAGYYDQAHLTRSFGRFIGQTPAAVSRGAAQLSFLYKTEAGR